MDKASTSNPVEARLRARIAAEGPISVADYMAEANAHYYATRDPLGAGGDFVTAPEISQMFGEIVGAWLADLWLRAGRPVPVRFVELGPGSGALAADALRAMRAAKLDPPIELVETSPLLRRVQAALLPSASWHDDLRSLPSEGPLLVVANEFFDALPVRQFGPDGRELMVDWRQGGFVRDPALRVIERSDVAIALVAALARRLRAQGGIMLIMDYGPDAAATGDTLQAVSRHRFADPWVDPGTRDLTAHVDFPALAAAAREQGISVFGPVPQGGWLETLGLGARAKALAEAYSDRAAEIEVGRERLTAPGQMGHLFKAMALVAPGWPEPAGF
ncbi:MAG: class I SAM-dependent methyltransferase [Sphingosinicella sp.]